MMRLLPLALLLFAVPAAAQQDSLLLEAVRMATEGHHDSARAVVATRLGALDPTSETYAEALFTAGLVADSADDAARYYRRVSIEYADSRWADRALLGLAQLAFAAGDMLAVRRSAERVLLDYPLSQVRAQAAFWAGRAAIDLRDPETGCARLADAERYAADDLELANRARFYLLRCANVYGIRAGDSAAAATDTTTTPPPSTRTVYAVQVAAVSSAAAADEAMRGVTEAGYTATVVRDTDGLFKVRVGAFAQRAQADALARDLRAALGGSPFVVETRP